MLILCRNCLESLQQHFKSTSGQWTPSWDRLVHFCLTSKLSMIFSCWAPVLLKYQALQKEQLQCLPCLPRVDYSCPFNLCKATKTLLKWPLTEELLSLSFPSQLRTLVDQYPTSRCCERLKSWGCSQVQLLLSPSAANSNLPCLPRQWNVVARHSSASSPCEALDCFT